MVRGKNNLFDNIRKRLEILSTADNDFVDSVKSTETSLWSSILNFLRSFTVKDGRIQKDESSSRTLATISRETRNVLQKSTLPKKVDLFLPKFDQVDNLSRDIYGEIVGDGFIAADTRVAKRQAINIVVKSLKEIKGLETQYLLPLQRQLFHAIETNMPFTDAVEMLRIYVKGETETGGQLARYSRQVATDLLNGYSGFVDWQMAKENDLDGFYYSGSLIKTSRKTCIDLVNGGGEYSDLSINGSLYPVEIIPEIVKRSKDNPGWRPETTANTFAIHRGGYRCRHNLIFVPLTRSDKARLEEIQQELDKLKDFDPENTGSE